ncbi:MAG: ATP synthase subunit B [Phycisphaerae bacterium SM23_33]|nr:MAG: ATP synthase subunit B [Phycisphaerae bacterium SM23_33]
MRKYYDQITEIAGSVVKVTAPGVAYDELAAITTSRETSLAQVIRLEGDQVSLQVFAGTQGISTGDKVRFFGGAGRPRDGKPELVEHRIDIGSPAINPTRRLRPSKMVRTGIPMIDVFNTLVESQKLPFFSVAGEPYNELLARVALQAEADVIILGGLGLRHDDYLTFRHAFEEGGVSSRALMFIHTAADPVVECLMVPDLCMAVGENFALQGKRVLTLLTDMTAFADALKEIAITMQQIPSNRGYPGDLYTQLARRYEKAVDLEGAGSMTVLAVTTMPGDDVTHPIPDNTGYITEGQFYLRNGRIEPFGSLSRLKQLVNDKTRDDHRAIMDACIKLYAGARESREKRAMGFESSAWDLKLLKYGQLFEDRIMDLAVNIPLEEALDRCWEALAECFEPQEVGIRRVLVDKHWPRKLPESRREEQQKAALPVAGC